MRTGGASIDSRVSVAALDRPLQRALRSIRYRLDNGEPFLAMRELDRASRTMAEHSAIFAPMLGRLLLRYGAEPALALATLMRAAQLMPSADVEADLVQCWLSMGRLDEARRCLVAALSRYACAPGDALAQAARSLMAFNSDSVPGFVALTPELKLYAETYSCADSVFELRAADGCVLFRTEVAARGTRNASCHLEVPFVDLKQFVIVTADRRSLAGGERIFPVDFRLDGRSTANAGRVEGWVSLGWNPCAPVELEISDAHGGRRRIRAGRRDPHSRWHFRLDVHKAGLGNRLRIDVLLPDGTRSELTDSPLLLKPELDAQLRRLRRDAQRRTAATSVKGKPQLRPVTVIIPVYEGHAETLACIDAVWRTTADLAAAIVVVDDATPDIALAADLDALAEQGRITLLRNPVNQGFAASINRAMAVQPTHDAVLVNADVLVFGDWLQRLQRAACSAADIGSATPFSDDDSIAGYGGGRVGAVDAALAEALDRFAATGYRQTTVELPVGVGFCLYLRRDCWDETGPFDAAVFCKGYGEESDWCMRARKRGWRHVLAADVLVHHAGGRSFGTRRQALQERAQRLMNLRHAGYDRYVQDFLKADPLRGLRRGFGAYRLCAQDRPITLVLNLALRGGVERFVHDRCRRLREQGSLPVLLRPLELGPDACALWSPALRISPLRFNVPDEIRALRELLKALPIKRVEVHHFLGLSGNLVQAALSLGVPFDVYLHDYSWICPRITLMDETNRYCGEPGLRGCERCVERNGSELMDPISVAGLRQRSLRWLRGASRVIAPSRDTARRYGRYFPGLSIDVVPLEAEPPLRTQEFPRSAGMVRVALIGAIGEHKGYAVLLACARDAVARGLDLEFVLIGRSIGDAALLKTGKVFVTGEYAEHEVPELLRREQPHLIWLPSVWPETWCYTLTHALSFGVPVLAFNIGAVAERLQALGAGELLDLNSSPSEINDRLLRRAEVEVAA